MTRGSINETTKQSLEAGEDVKPMSVHGEEAKDLQHDNQAEYVDPFGEEGSSDDVQYKTLSWL